MGENQGLQHVLEKLTQLLTEKTSGAPSSGKAIVTHAETVQKIELMQNDVKLESEKLPELVTEGIVDPEDKRAGELCQRRTN